jgi:hypothetical protein
MTTPTTYLQIRVLGEHVDIQWLPQRLLPDCYGQNQTDQREIQVRDNLTGMQCLDTVIHELNHYISDRCRLDLSEQQVHLLGMAWSTLFADNPDFLEFIAQRIEEENERRTS